MSKELTRLRSHTKLCLTVAAFAWCLLNSTCAQAQNRPATALNTPSSTSQPTNERRGQAAHSKPRNWSDLSPIQQQVLAPLASTWATLQPQQQSHWVRLSQRYGRMPPQQQSKLQENMKLWAALSPEQRDKARLQFADAQRSGTAITPEQWQAYQALSPDAKRQLRRSAHKLPPRTALRAQATPARRLNSMTLQGHSARSVRPTKTSRQLRRSAGANRPATPARSP